MDPHTWVIRQLERGVANGMWTSEYSEQMTKNSGIFTRSDSTVNTRNVNSAKMWIISALTCGANEGWFSKSDIHKNLADIGINI
tara:strand:- start:43 stop:294 length:252 start_codon:yes stop_codon:yes gene_type:complete